MDAKRWQAVKHLFAQAHDLSGARRDAFLLSRSDVSDEILAEVRSLLAHADPEPEGSAPLPSVPRYAVLEILGRGGMGTVYLARRDDAQFEQNVAIKILRNGLDSRDALDRFLAERQILASLHHPNIARVLDGGSLDDDRPYLVMEYVDGDCIDTYCESRRLGVRERIALLLKVCEAVAYAHRNLVVHRDIKSGNILVTGDGTPVLVDFGIAKLLDPGAIPGVAAHVTRTNVRPMTPAHASPEQVSGNPITTASDVYGIGVLLYRLLTGEQPFDSTTSSLALQQAICNDIPQRPSLRLAQRDGRRAAALDADLDNIVMTALRKEPERRYASVGLLAADLRRYLDGEPVSAHPDSLRYRMRKFSGRHRRSLAAAAVFFVALVSLVVWHAISLERERQIARHEARNATQIADFLQTVFERGNPDAGYKDIRVVDILDDAALEVEALAARDAASGNRLRRTLARTYAALGALDKASAMLARTAASERVHNPRGPRVETMRALAYLHWRKGEPHLAAAWSRKALTAYRDEHPRDRARIAELTIEHAGDLIRAGDLGGAQTHLVDAGSQAPASGLPAATRATAHRHLARIADLRHDFATADEHARRAYELLETALGKQHTSTIAARQSLGSIAAKTGRLDEAIEHYGAVLADIRRRHGEDTSRGATVLEQIADLHRRQSRLDTAETMMLDALAIKEASLPAGHLMLGYSYFFLSELYTQSGRLDEALDYARRSLAISNVSLGPAHPDTVYDYMNLGAIFMARGEPAAAAEFFAAAVDVMEKVFGDDNDYTQEGLRSLIEAFAAAGQPERSASYASRLRP